ncbi:hypothetical protein [Aliiroseovarius marinus]|uniref:hypothetical protein n=1 Tax=Aliiroseovarius marinus TaxID=2500159 RepID=UPI003D7E1D66
MSQSVTYYPDHALVYLDYSGDIELMSLSARVAEWMITLAVPLGYTVVMDLRAFKSVDRPVNGLEEFLALQEKLHQHYAPADRMLILAPSPESYVFARILEQMSEGKVPTVFSVLRDEADVLGALGVQAGSLDSHLAGLGHGVTLR